MNQASTYNFGNSERRHRTEISDKKVFENLGNIGSLPVGSVEYAECGVRSVENAECRKCGV